MFCIIGNFYKVDGTSHRKGKISLVAYFGNSYGLLGVMKLCF